MYNIHHNKQGTCFPNLKKPLFLASRVLIRKASVVDHKLGQQEGFVAATSGQNAGWPYPQTVPIRFAFIASERWLGPSSTHKMSHTVYVEVLYFIKLFETRIYLIPGIQTCTLESEARQRALWISENRGYYRSQG